MAFDLKLDNIDDIAPAIEKLLPLAAAGVKAAIFLIRDLGSLWAQDAVSPEQIAGWKSARKNALASLLSHQFPA